MTLDRPRRTGLLCFVAVASLAYVALLIGTLAPQDRALFVMIKIAAGLSWPIFGLSLYRSTRWKPTVWHWFDACLLTMCPGLLIMLLGAGVNVLIPQPVQVAVQIAMLCVTNLVMLAIFHHHARKLNVSTPAILLTWLGGLIAPFALILTVLRLATEAA